MQHLHSACIMLCSCLAATIDTNPYSISCKSANVRFQIVCVCWARPFLCLHSRTHTLDTNECILSIIKCNLKPSRRVLICMLSLMVRIISVSVSVRRVSQYSYAQRIVNVMRVILYWRPNANQTQSTSILNNNSSALALMPLMKQQKEFSETIDRNRNEKIDNVDRGGTMKSCRAVWFLIESSDAVDMLTMALHATIYWIIQHRRLNLPYSWKWMRNGQV